MENDIKDIDQAWDEFKDDLRQWKRPTLIAMAWFFSFVMFMYFGII